MDTNIETDYFHQRIKNIDVLFSYIINNQDDKAMEYISSSNDNELDLTKDVLFQPENFWCLTKVDENWTIKEESKKEDTKAKKEESKEEDAQDSDESHADL